jgi:hypothetical protein
MSPLSGVTWAPQKVEDLPQDLAEEMKRNHDLYVAATKRCVAGDENTPLPIFSLPICLLQHASSARLTPFARHVFILS